MNITEITPPTPRTFNIELGENELKLLGLIVGTTNEDRYVSIINQNRVSYDLRPKYEPRFTHKVYDLITNILRS